MQRCRLELLIRPMRSVHRVLHILPRGSSKPTSFDHPCPSLSNLKEVFWRIEYKAGESREGGRKSFPIFVGALDEFSRADYEAHYLATIRVEYDGCAEYIQEELNELLDGQRWRWLDEILQRPAFSNLREVKFGFTVRCCRSRGDIFSNKGWGEHSGCISSQLSNLNQRGILTLTAT